MVSGENSQGPEKGILRPKGFFGEEGVVLIGIGQTNGASLYGQVMTVLILDQKTVLTIGLVQGASQG